MNKSQKRILDIADRMVENDKDLVSHYEGIDAMVNSEWNLPSEIAALKWMRKVISSDPQSALETARRTLSTIEPIPFYQPTNKNEETKIAASEIEMNLLWQLKQANKRSKKDLVGDIVESALRYDKVCVQTIPLKWQMEGQAEMEGEIPTRYRAAKNKGGFIVEVHNPKDVHDRWTPLGLDAVLLAKTMSSREAVGFYGDVARELKEKAEEFDEETFVTVFDYWDYDRRLITCTEPTRHRHKQKPTASKYVFVDSEDDEETFNMEFLGGWTIKEGGSSLDVAKQHSVRPMLGMIEKTGLWETQNIIQSIVTSEVIGYSAAPRLKITGPDSEGVRVDYGDINKPLRLKPGEDVEQMTPPVMDQNMMHVNDRIQAAIDKYTVAKSLQNLDFPSGTAFATVNAVIKSATAALDPFKSLAEDAIADILENILLWTHFTEEPLVGYGYKEDDMGHQYILESKYIDPANVYIDVKLTAHVPTDYLQRIEAAIAMKNQLNFPKDESYKHLDVTNPDQLVDKWRQERLDDHEFQLRMREMAADTDLRIQQKQMALQMQAQQAAQQAQMRQQMQMQRGNVGQRVSRPTESQAEVQRAIRQQLGQNGGERTGTPRNEALTEAVRGNPARTGISPNQSNPQGNLREQRTFRAKGGEERA